MIILRVIDIGIKRRYNRYTFNSVFRKLIIMEDFTKNYSKFPALLKSKLISGEIEFSESTEFVYSKILAYRGVIRNRDDDLEVKKEDMRSYAELNRKKLRGQKYDQTDPCYYGVSFFEKKSQVQIALKFPRPNKKIIEGYIYMEGGPKESNTETGHVCWWLYENTDVSGFKICED